VAYPQNVKLGDDFLKFTMIGEIYAKIHRLIEGKIKTVTIIKNKANQYYASVLLEDDKEPPRQSTEGKAIGLDM
jgi:putative transposase